MDLRERIPASSRQGHRQLAAALLSSPGTPLPTLRGRSGRLTRRASNRPPCPYIYIPPRAGPSSTRHAAPDRVLRIPPIGVSLRADLPRGAAPVSVRDSGGRAQKSETGCQQSGYTNGRWMWKSLWRGWKTLRIPAMIGGENVETSHFRVTNRLGFRSDPDQDPLARSGTGFAVKAHSVGPDMPEGHGREGGNRGGRMHKFND